MDKLLNDTRFFKLLMMVDADLAKTASLSGCFFCGGKLHCGDYPRLPRGGPVRDKRFSFCCSKCRKRKTPPSVVFLGRKVYLGVVVVLVGAMMHGLHAKRVERLRQVLGIDERTLGRWRAWWMETFVASPFWKGAHARFSPVLDDVRMPLSLVEAFQGEVAENMVRLLTFLAPITVGAFPGGGAM
jgi:hypothetical protein